MDFNGKEINSLEDVKNIFCTDEGLKNALNVLETIPKKIEELVSERNVKIAYVEGLLELASTFADPKSEALMMMVVKQLCPNQAGTDLEAKLLLKQKDVKKSVLEKTKEIAKEAEELVAEIGSFCTSVLSMDAPGVLKSSNKIINTAKSALTKTVSTVKDKKSWLKVGRNVTIAGILTAFAAWVFGYPIGSTEYFAFTGVGSSTVAAVSSKDVLKKLKIKK